MTETCVHAWCKGDPINPFWFWFDLLALPSLLVILVVLAWIKWKIR